MKATINGKEYEVEYVFNMVGNYHFIDEDGVHYLVDAEDVGVWAEEEAVEWTDGIDMAIKYAEYYGEDGTPFWWEAYKIERDWNGVRRIPVIGV